MNTRLWQLLRRIWLRQRPFALEHTLPRPAKMPIIPTSYGMMLGILLLLMFVWSANHQLNLGYALTFLVAVLMMLSAGLTVSELAGLSVRCRQAKPVFAGEYAAFPIEIIESHGRSRGGMTLMCDDGQATNLRGITADTAIVASLCIPALKRGWLTLPTVTLYSTYPLGWFVSWQWLRLQGRVLVYPLPQGNLPLPQADTSVRGDAGQSVGGDDEFEGLSEYRYGDALSRIAWKHSHSHTLYVKQFSAQGAQHITLEMKALSGNLETRLSQLTRWVVDAEATGMLYSLRLNDGQFFPHAHGERHYQQCLRALALYGERTE